MRNANKFDIAAFMCGIVGSMHVQTAIVASLMDKGIHWLSVVPGLAFSAAAIAFAVQGSKQ